MQPSVTDWISSIGSLVGAVTGVGALVVSILSYLKSREAIEREAVTRGVLADTLGVIEQDAASPSRRSVLPEETASTLGDLRRRLE